MGMVMFFFVLLTSKLTGFIVSITTCCFLCLALCVQRPPTHPSNTGRLPTRKKMPPQPRRRFGSLAGVLLLVLAVLCLGLVQPTQGVWLGLRARQQLQHQQQQSDWLGSLANAARTVANKAISGAARSQTSAGTSAARKEYLAGE